ncbi:MAG: FAD-dependent oxidoreductase, partial [Bradyrhizobium sp.]
YGETLGGWQPHFDTFTPMDCYQSPGVLLPGIKAFPVGLAVGDAFAGVQAYTFRLCVTDDLVNKAPWPKPAGYDPLQFEYLRRQAPLSDPNWKPFSLNPVGGGKYDINGDFFSPEQWDWSNANAATRATLLQLAYKRQAGWFWFLANDPSVNSTTQAYVNSVGLCRDEFLGGGLVSGWPYELYSRVSRRMVGQYVMRESDLITNTTKTKVIALGFYSRDQHESALYAVEVGGIPGFIKDGANAGDVDARQVVPGYHQSLEAFLPVATDCNNLIVVNAASMSAVAAASMRIDMHKASAAAALGYAAAKCVITGANINVLDVAALQLDLTARGHPLSFTPPA